MEGGGRRVCVAHVCDLTTMGVKQHLAGGLCPAPTAIEPSALKTAATCSCFNVCSIGPDPFTCRGILGFGSKGSGLLFTE